MKCTDLEALLCDYVDGTLSAGERATVELHLEGCAECRELMEDSRAALQFMETAADVEPPPALVNAILYEVRSGGSTPVRKTGAKSWLGRLFEPILQPKFAMGMAMTILSFSMLGRVAGLPVRPFRPSDLEPARVWAALEDKAFRSYERAKKYYESLRLVYEVQQTLRDWSETDASQAATAEGAAAPAQAQPATGQAKPGEAMEGPIEVPPQGESGRNRTDGRVKK